MVWLLLLWGAAAIEENKKKVFLPRQPKERHYYITLPTFSLSLSNFFTASLHITILLLHLGPAKKGKKVLGKWGKRWKKLPKSPQKKY